MSIDTNKKSAFFSDMLKRAMKENNWTQSELAKEIGKDKGTLSKWINKEQAPYPSTVIKIANLLGYAVQIDSNTYKYEADRGSLSMLNEPESNYGKDLNSILLRVLDEASEADKKVLGQYFLKVLHLYNRS